MGDPRRPAACRGGRPRRPGPHGDGRGRGRPGRTARGVPPAPAAARRPRPHARPPRRRRRGRAVRPGGRHPRGGAGHRPAARRRGLRPRPARRRRDGQVRGTRAQLRVRRRRDLRVRAGRGCRRERGRPRRGTAGRPPDPDLLRAHGRGHDLAGGRRPAPRGQGRSAGADPGQPPGVLRALGEDLGVPGPAQGAPGGGRPRPRPPVRRDAGAAGLDGRGARRVRHRHPGDAPPGRRPHPAPGGRPPDQARVRRAARRRVRGAAAPARPRPRGRADPGVDHAERPGPADPRWLRRPRGRGVAQGGVLLPAHPRAPHPALRAAAHARRTRRRGGAAAARAQHGVLQGPDRDVRQGLAAPPPRGAAGCTRSCSTGRCSRPSRRSPARTRGSRRRPPGSGCRHWGTPTRRPRCATSRR